MRYIEFLKELRTGIEKRMGEKYRILIKASLKENGKRVKGIEITHCERQSLSFMAYGESYYQYYLENEDMDKCIQSIMSVYEECKDKSRGDIDSLRDWDRCKRFIYPFLISRDMNKELLKKLVYRTYLDFAICYMIRFPQEESDSYAVCRIHNDMLGVWEIGNDELHEVAMRNCQEDGYKIVNMLEIMGDILNEDLKDEMDTCGMYVLSNQCRRYGATGILDGEMLAEFAEKIENNFYILPSSLHEVILISCKDDFEEEQLNQMVHDVNEDVVDLSDILSDHVYYYDREKRKIENL